MKILMLSYFDTMLGPKILFKTPKHIEDEDIDKVTKLIELYNKECFQHWLGTYKSMNIVFEIPYQHSDKKFDLFQISLLIDSGEFNSAKAKKILENFIIEFSRFEDIHNIIYEEEREKFIELNKWFENYYDSITDDIYVSKDDELNDAIPDMMFYYSKNGIHLDFRPGKGISPMVPPEKFLGYSVYDILPTTVAKKNMEYIRKALKTGMMQIYKYVLPMDGIPTKFEARFLALSDDKVLSVVRAIKPDEDKSEE